MSIQNLAGAVLLLATTTSAGPVSASPSAPIAPIVDGYLERYFETFPSRATAAGRYDRDGQLELLDEADRGAWVDFNRATIAALQTALAAGRQPRDDRFDAELLLRQAKRVLFHWERRARPEHDPLFWSGRLANATLMLTVREDRPAAERLAAAVKRAEQLPRLAATARIALERGNPARIPRAWVESAERQSRSAATFYRDGFPQVALAQAPALERNMAAAGTVAADALIGFADYLAELAPQASGSPRLGDDYAELFGLFSNEERSPAEILAAAERALAEKREEAAAYGRSVWAIYLPGEPPAEDAEVIRALFARVADDHAGTADELVADFKRLLLESEHFVRERGLITLPDPLTVRTDRSPAYFTGQGVGGVYPAGPYAPESDTLFYLPTPSDRMTSEQREAFFRDFNDHFNLMITPHEMVPGHYLQGKIAARHPRKVRSLFGDGVYVEGWGTFCERLLLDEGWGGPLDRLAHLKKQLENIARTIVDIRVHTQDMSREEVLAFVQEEAFQEAHFANNMWMRATTSAPQITSYWLGYEQHRALFADAKAARGEDFDLREYLDAMVAEGGIPIAAYRELLLGGGVPTVATATPRFDHHLHIQSAAGAALLNRVSAIAEKLGEEPAGEPASAVTAADAIAALDAAGVRHGAVLSNAYMLGMPEVVAAAGADAEAEAALVRSENAWVAAQAAQYRGRLIALCSVNPLRPYALEELDRCAADARIAGLKLHFANSDIDLRNADQLARLADLFERLDHHGRPALVHLRTRSEGYGREDARRFIDDALARAPNVPIQIAHMAGWGGYDEATDAALSTFIDAFRNRELSPERFVFGLGAVVFSPAAAAGNEALAEQVRDANELLARRIGQLGVSRVVYATDWPSWPPVREARSGIVRNIELVRAELALEQVAFDQILTNPGVLWTIE